MANTLFLQSDLQNPWQFYKTMLAENPVYWDAANQLWAIYAYKDCVAVLASAEAHIPSVPAGNKDGLNEYALLIMEQLARLSNDLQHTIAREVAMLLFQKMKNNSIKDIVEQLLKSQAGAAGIDWVHSIGKKLPVMLILKSFGFKEADIEFITGKMESFVKIMAAFKTAEQVKQINEMSKELYIITERHLLATGIHQPIIQSLHEKYKIEPGKIMVACTGNLIGLLIQGYDAGRGLLSNAILQILDNNNGMKPDLADTLFVKKSIIETLRFDPPVQNTRRVAARNILLNHTEITQGQTLLLVLAAANRDPQHFDHPEMYAIERPNNNEHLTFGFGHHQCLANHFSVYLATETLLYFFERYKEIRLIEQTIQYEPAVNVRLPKEIMIALR